MTIVNVTIHEDILTYMIILAGFFYKYKIQDIKCREIKILFFVQNRIIIQFYMEKMRCGLRYNVGKNTDEH